jgi:hypothetical protein
MAQGTGGGEGVRWHRAKGVGGGGKVAQGTAGGGG